MPTSCRALPCSSPSAGPPGRWRATASAAASSSPTRSRRRRSATGRSTWAIWPSALAPGAASAASRDHPASEARRGSLRPRNPGSRWRSQAGGRTTGAPTRIRRSARTSSASCTLRGLLTRGDAPVPGPMAVLPPGYRPPSHELFSGADGGSPRFASTSSPTAAFTGTAAARLGRSASPGSSFATD